jgi:hypothetical protein
MALHGSGTGRRNEIRPLAGRKSNLAASWCYSVYCPFPEVVGCSDGTACIKANIGGVEYERGFTMTGNASVLRGIVHGKTIELEREPGLPDGQTVSVVVQPLEAHESPLPPGEGIRRSAGGWDDDPEGLDAYLEWNRRSRKRGRPEIPD